MRFTIRDVLWFTTLASMAIVWAVDRSQQNAEMRAMAEIADLEAHQVFPRDWDGKVGAFRNQIVILRMQVADLTRELKSRGHRVEIDDCGKIVVDRPFSQPLLPAPSRP
jgi:hypothetical protein